MEIRGGPSRICRNRAKLLKESPFARLHLKHTGFQGPLQVGDWVIERWAVSSARGPRKGRGETDFGR